MFQILNKLKQLLTPANLQFLDKILMALLDTHHPAYDPFWNEFKSQFREGEKAKRQAAIGLAMLREILQEYREGK